MTDREVMAMALEALENVYGKGKKCDAAITALRQLLEQPEAADEPVAWMHVDAYQPSNRHLEWKESCKGYKGDRIKHPLYTRPCKECKCNKQNAPEQKGNLS